MPSLNVVRRRLRALFRRQTVETEMDHELRLHFELAVAEGMRRGLTQEEARAAALREFRGMDVVKEAYRDARGVRVIEELAQDIRFGLRSLRKAPSCCGHCLTRTPIASSLPGRPTARAERRAKAPRCPTTTTSSLAHARSSRSPQCARCRPIAPPRARTPSGSPPPS